MELIPPARTTSSWVCQFAVDAQEVNDGAGKQQEKRRRFPPEGAEDSLLGPSDAPRGSGEGTLLNLMFKPMIPVGNGALALREDFPRNLIP